MTAFGAEAEFEALENRIRKTETQSEPVVSEETRNGPAVASLTAQPKLETIAVLSYVDLDGIGSLQPIPAAVQITKKLEDAVARIRGYFEVPEKIVDAESVGVVLAKFTGVEQWSDFVPLVDELGRAANVLAALQEGPEWLHIAHDRGFQANTESFRNSARKIASASYRLSKALPDLVSRSLKPMPDRPVKTLSVAVYVDGSPEGMADVLERVDVLVRVLGYGDHIDEVDERGSWFRRFTSALRIDVSEESARHNRERAEQAVKLAYLEAHFLETRQAQVDATISDSVAQLIKALDDVPVACVRAGSILLVKYQSPQGPVIITRLLSQAESAILERHPEIMRTPSEVMETLLLEAKNYTIGSGPEN